MVKRHTADSDFEDDNASTSNSSSSSEEEAAGIAASKGGLSEYEKQRLSRIAENKARLEALGLSNIASSLKGLSSSSNCKKNKGKEKVKDEDDDDEEYRPDGDEGEGEPTSDSSSEDEECDKDEDFEVGNAPRSRKRKQVKNNSSKTKGKAKVKVSGKKHRSINSEYIGDDYDDDEALRQAIALSLQDTLELSSNKMAEKKGNIHIQEDKGRKKNKKSFASRLQMTEDEVTLHFFQIDDAGKGTVTIRDLQRAAIAHDFEWTDKELVDMIRCFDSNGDGKLSLDDFRKIIVRCNLIKES